MNPIKFLIIFAKICLVVGVLSIVALLIAYFFLVSPPDKFSKPVTVTVDKGQGALSISKELQTAGIVRSGKIAANLMTYFGREKRIQAGVYVFKTPESVIVVAKRIVKGDFGYTPVKVTVPEGSNYRQLASIIHAKFGSMATSTLEAELKPLEGYLFPDTYFFAPFATQDEIVKKLKETFVLKTKPLQDQIAASGRSLAEVISLASILEEEVQTTEDRKMVAYLLLKRMEVGMPLQVDASLAYVNGKTSAQMTLGDLKTNHPYNSYTNKGLPPTPISNPGLDTITAALNPTPNDYVFYLSDKDGITRFSKTFKEHVQAKQKYLR